MASAEHAQDVAKRGSGKISPDRILNEAAELFMRHGYRKTRLEDVAQVLGVTRPAIYYHFKAKQDLLVAIELRAIERLMAVADEIDREQHPPAELFWRHIEGHITYVASHPIEARIVFEEEEELPDDVKQQLRETRRAYTQRLIDLYTEAVIAGEVPSGDPRLAVNTILGAATWVYRWYRPELWANPRVTAKEMIRVLRPDSWQPPPKSRSGAKRRRDG